METNQVGHRSDTDYQRCLILQNETDQELIVTPSAHEIILKYIRERAGYGDGNFSEISRRIGNVTQEMCYLAHKVLPNNRQCHNVQASKGTLCNSQSCVVMPISQPVEGPSPVLKQLPTPRSFASSVIAWDHVDTYSTMSPRLYNVGKMLRNVVKKCDKDTFRVKLSTSINPENIHAIGIGYHQRGWATHVTNVEITKKHRHLRQVQLMCRSSSCYRKTLKRLLETEIPEVQFHKSKRVNKA